MAARDDAIEQSLASAAATHVFRGMGITVYDVLSYLAAGETVAEVLDDFPYLTAEDIQACFVTPFTRRRQRMQVAVARSCYSTST